MTGGLRGNEPQGDVGSTGAMPSQEAIDRAIYDALLTLRIEQEPLLLSDVADIFSTVTRLHAKLTLISKRNFLHSSRDLVAYLATDNPMYVRTANLTVAIITKNSPLTLVLVVSEAVGKALSSLIDAVSQTRIRYEKAKLELEQVRREIAQRDAQVQLQLWQQVEVHEVAMRERLIELESRRLELEAQQRAQKDDESYREIDKIHRITEASMEVISQLHPEAEVEARQMLSQAIMTDLLDLSNYTGLVAESVTPRKSA